MRPMPAPLGLYIHIPFCKSKCVYCDFYSLPRSESRMDDYTDALCAHLAETAPFAAGHLVDTVYFGGGTPSYLGTKRLVKILKTILKKYKVDKQAEITLEANPDSAGDWKELRTLRRCGFNRLSLGMQSADDEELSEIGRVHTMAQTEAAVEAARKAKFQNLSLDLIYGLPHQTLEGWQKNLSAALDLTPEHLSCYGLAALDHEVLDDAVEDGAVILAGLDVFQKVGRGHGSLAGIQTHEDVAHAGLQFDDGVRALGADVLGGGQQGAGQQQDGQQTGEESEFLHEGFSLMICRTMPVRQAHGSMCRGERQGKGRPETRRRRGSG